MRENFDMEFNSDDEIEGVFQDLDEFIRHIRIEADSANKEMVPNIIRMKQMDFSYAVLKYLTKDLKDVSVYHEFLGSNKSVASITAEGESLTFSKPEWFARVAEFANNVEAYTLTNGKVRMSFMFYGLAVPAK